MPGAPRPSCDALVAAANEAGGRDNVTVVYAEGPEFARAVRGRAPGGGPATAPDAAPPGATATGTWAQPFAEPVENGLPRSAGNRSRALLLVVRAQPHDLVRTGSRRRRRRRPCCSCGARPETQPPGSRTIAVRPSASETFGTLVRRPPQPPAPGDVLRLEPGTYAGAGRRSTDGVSLTARVPGSVTFVRPPVSGDDWVAVAADGELGGHISGIRIESTAGASRWMSGIRVTGQSRSLELIAGRRDRMRAAVGARRPREHLRRSTRRALHRLAPPRSSWAERRPASRRSATSSVRSARAARRADTRRTRRRRPRLRHNVFAGYGADVVKGLDRGRPATNASPPTS